MDQILEKPVSTKVLKRTFALKNSQKDKTGFLGRTMFPLESPCSWHGQLYDTPYFQVQQAVLHNFKDFFILITVLHHFNFYFRTSPTAPDQAALSGCTPAGPRSNAVEQALVNGNPGVYIRVGYRYTTTFPEFDNLQS